MFNIKHGLLISGFFIFCSVGSLDAQTITLKMVQDEISKGVDIEKAIKKIDTISASKILKANQDTINRESDLLKAARAEYLKLPKRNQDIELIGLQDKLNKTLARNDTLEKTYNGLVKKKGEYNRSNGSVDQKELEKLSKELYDLKSDSIDNDNMLKKERDSVKIYDNKIQDAQQIRESNKSMINEYIKYYDETAKTIAELDTCNVFGLASLAELRKEFSKMGIDTNKLFNLGDYLQYCSSIKLVPEAFKVIYEKNRVQSLIQQIGALKNKNTLTKLQKNKLEYFYQALSDYCLVSNQCATEIFNKNSFTKTGLKAQKDATDLIDKLFAEKNAQRYPFLMDEWRRLKNNVGKQDGFLDCKIPKCTN